MSGPAKQEVCARGHPLVGANVIECKPPRGRKCRACAEASKLVRQDLMRCDSCGAEAGHACRNDDETPAPTCKGRKTTMHACSYCGVDLPRMGRRKDAERPTCGKEKCQRQRKREWTRADRAKKREVTT